MKALTYTLKHAVILILGVILALICAGIVYRSADLSASVLSLSERQYMQQVHRDAAYKRFDTEIEVFISSQLQALDQMYISFLFSPTNIEIFHSLIASPYTVHIIEQKAGALLLKISDFSGGNVDEGVVIVPFS